MSRIYKGSESTLRLLIGKSHLSISNLRIKLYTTDVEDAIEVIDGIELEDNIAIIRLAGRAFMGMEDGIINYIVEGVVEGDLYHTERQSNYTLRSLSFINENGVASSTKEITNNGTYKVTPNDGLYVDVKVNVPDFNGAYDDGYREGKAEGYTKGYTEGKNTGLSEGRIEGYGEGYTEGKTEGLEEGKAEGVAEQKSKLEAIEINTNGIYTKEDGYNRVDVNIPIQEEATLTLYTGDKGTLLPNEGYDAFAKVNYEVKKSNADKMKIKEGICLSGSTFTSFDGSEWDWSNVHDCSYMFQGCSNLTSAPTGLNVKPYAMSNMFDSCSNLTDISSLADMDTSEVAALNVLFGGCSNLTDLSPISNWKTSKVTNMHDMFIRCINLTSVDLSNWDISNVADMGGMFAYCSKLKEIKLGGPIRSDVELSYFDTLLPSTGTLYYPKEYDYTPIINALPSRWTAVAY